MLAGCASHGNEGVTGRETPPIAATSAASPEALRACLAAAAQNGDSRKFLEYLDQATPLRAAAAKAMASAVDTAAAKLALQEAVRAKYGSDALNDLNPLFVFPNHDDGLKRMARQFQTADIQQDEGHTFLVIQKKPAEVIERGGLWKVIPAVPPDATVADLHAITRRNLALRDGLHAGKDLVAKSLTVPRLNDDIQTIVDKYMLESLPEEKPKPKN